MPPGEYGLRVLCVYIYRTHTYREREREARAHTHTQVYWLKEEVAPWGVWVKGQICIHISHTEKERVSE